MNKFANGIAIQRYVLRLLKTKEKKKIVRGPGPASLVIDLANQWQQEKIQKRRGRHKGRVQGSRA